MLPSKWQEMAIANLIHGEICQGDKNEVANALMNYLLPENQTERIEKLLFVAQALAMTIEDLEEAIHQSIVCGLYMFDEEIKKQALED
jgi:hypothetical protein